MVIGPSEIDPSISSQEMREVLILENEIDKHLLLHLISGKTSYLITASNKFVVDVLLEKYRKVGWTLTVVYSGDKMFRVEFEDPDQLEITRKFASSSIKSWL